LLKNRDFDVDLNNRNNTQNDGQNDQPLNLPQCSLRSLGGDNKHNIISFHIA